jgi:hypothetical protein
VSQALNATRAQNYLGTSVTTDSSVSADAATQKKKCAVHFCLVRKHASRIVIVPWLAAHMGTVVPRMFAKVERQWATTARVTSNAIARCAPKAN